MPCYYELRTTHGIVTQFIVFTIDNQQFDRKRQNTLLFQGYSTFIISTVVIYLTDTQGINLLQIGLGRADGEPCVPLLIKSLFTCMFWVTLRQFIQEIRQRRRSAFITDMAAPLQLTVSTAGKCFLIMDKISVESIWLTIYMYVLGRRNRNLKFYGLRPSWIC